MIIESSGYNIDLEKYYQEKYEEEYPIEEELEEFMQLSNNLMQENKQLKDNWNKLKEYIVNKYTEFEKEELDYFYGSKVTLVGIRNKMQELESGDSDE